MYTTIQRQYDYNNEEDRAFIIKYYDNTGEFEYSRTCNYHSALVCLIDALSDLVEDGDITITDAWEMRYDWLGYTEMINTTLEILWEEN